MIRCKGPGTKVNPFTYFFITSADFDVNFAYSLKKRDNTPYRIAKALSSHIADGLLPPYPFGTQLTAEELTLSASLRRIKALSAEPAQFLKEVARALLHRSDTEAARPWLERIHLMHPDSSKEFIIQQLLLLELEEHGLLKVR